MEWDDKKMKGRKAVKTSTEISEGRYLYCIVDNCVETDFGEMGIEDAKVFTVPFKDIGAVVHKCLPKPYDSKDEEKVKEWILSHQYIIDQASKKFGTVLPLTFDTIIKGNEETVRNWLKEEYKRLKKELKVVKDKSEYTVQIFWDDEFIMQRIEEKSKRIKELRREIKTKPKGVAYMLKKKLEGMLREQIREEAERYSRDFHNKIKQHVDELIVEKTKKEVPGEWKDMRQILNLSCLVHKDKVKELGKLLGEINEREGFAVRFTGPWAPFSFVGKKKKR